ncbi:unnamed protein product [Ilex paraguariensis]|uniref:OVATE domain-containing protein n=1 Tax=Ilex paraguariensis TaxID=185542 RepID=A0ABC8TYN9_9AQUA
MPKKLQKSLQDYLSKIKKPTTPQLDLPSKSLSSSISWIPRGCNRPRTLSFAVNPNEVEVHDNGDAATLEDIDRFLFQNFNSLYLKDDDEEEDHKKKDDQDVEEKSGGFIDPPPELRGSNRFFAVPGSSSSLMEEAGRSSMTASDDIGESSSTKTTTTTGESEDAKEVMGPDDFIAVLTYSQSPHCDFRQSMKEMIGAQMDHRGKVDWEFMEELLIPARFQYLEVEGERAEKRDYVTSLFYAAAHSVLRRKVLIQLLGTQ